MHLPSFREIVSPESSEAMFRGGVVSLDLPADEWMTMAEQRLNIEGFLTLQDVPSIGELGRIAGRLGNIRVHPQTNKHGVTKIISGTGFEDRKDTFVNPFDQEQELHSDGTAVADPPDLLAVYCREMLVPEMGRTSVFVRGRELHDTLQREDPVLFKQLHEEITFAKGVNGGVFTQLSEHTKLLRFRQNPAGSRMTLTKSAMQQANSRMRSPDLLFGVSISEPGRAIIFNNTSMLHGLSIAQEPGRVAERLHITARRDSGVNTGFRFTD